LIGTSYGSKILTVDRPLTDLSTIKISDLYDLPLSQKNPLKNGILAKMTIFGVGFSQEIRSFEKW
jgi:hypothetical protein